MLVLHYTGMASGEAALQRLRDPVAEVSAHYLVHENGQVVQLVHEFRRAWHAGAGTWAGEDDLNSGSIGIEIVNGGHPFGLPPYPDEQIEAVIRLSRDIVGRWAIRPERVLGHSDIAPARKEDPGEHFPWARLAAMGVGRWVEPAPDDGDNPTEPLRLGACGASAAELNALLRSYGYTAGTGEEFDAATALSVTAFQRHFRPMRVDGVADPATIEVLRRLVSVVGR